MRLNLVMDEAAAAIKQIAGLRESFAYPPASLSVSPCGYVSYPQSVDFDQEYQRGGDQFTDLPIVLVAGKAVDRLTRDLLAAWASGDGPESVKAALEAWEWTTCDDLTVTSCEFIPEEIGGVPYLAALFKATVVGPGEG